MPDRQKVPQLQDEDEIEDEYENEDEDVCAWCLCCQTATGSLEHFRQRITQSGTPRWAVRPWLCPHAKKKLGHNMPIQATSAGLANLWRRPLNYSVR